MVYKRPPFTGIHETLPRAGTGAPNEGGGDIPPYGEDIINKIVDVNFGGGDGGIFVSGDLCCFFRYANVDGVTLEQEWIGLGSLDFGDGGIIYCSSYGNPKGKPTFLMGGRGEIASIMLSHDGINWVTIVEEDFWGAAYDIIWNASNQKFYANISGRGPVQESPDGYVWADSSVTYDEFYHMGLIDGFGDGYAGYDPDNDLIILPHQVPVIYADCTAFMGGVWMAGGLHLETGSSATASSIDGGETWEIVSVGRIGMNLDYNVVTMVAASHSDF